MPLQPPLIDNMIMIIKLNYSGETGQQLYLSKQFRMTSNKRRRFARTLFKVLKYFLGYSYSTNVVALKSTFKNGVTRTCGNTFSLGNQFVSYQLPRSLPWLACGLTH